MSVYVDTAITPFGRMLMCHMVADSHTELMEMAAKLDLKSKWLQHENTYKEHFDICLSKRTQAINLGAVVINRRQLASFLARKRKVYDALQKLA
jgi:DNA/RNA endonuclease G (NUC1)